MPRFESHHQSRAMFAVFRLEQTGLLIIFTSSYQARSTVEFFFHFTVIFDTHVEIEIQSQRVEAPFANAAGMLGCRLRIVGYATLHPLISG